MHEQEKDRPSDEAPIKPEGQLLKEWLEYSKGTCGITKYVSGECKTYLVPVDDSEYHLERIKALRENGIPCRLLPKENDEYSPEEKVFAKDILNANPYDLKYPLRPRHEQVSAIIYDPLSTVSVVDVMVATGRDDKETRRIRHSLLHGEAPPEAKSLIGAISLLKRSAVKGSEATYILRKPGVIKSLASFAEIAITEGLNADSIKVLGELGINSGIDIELLNALGEGRPEAQKEVLSVWQKSLQLAKTYNKKAFSEGVYTEVHLVGRSLVLLSAIEDTTDYFKNYESQLGFVNVYSNHTLAQNYAGELNPIVYKPLDTIVFGSSMAIMAKKLNFDADGPSTIRRRCMTTFDDDGQPVVHLYAVDDDRRYRMSDNILLERLRSLGINADVHKKSVASEKIIKEASRNNKDVNLSTDIKMSAKYKPNDKQNEPIAVITSLRVNGEEAKSEWLAGFSPYHHELRMESQQVDDVNIEEPIEVIIDGMTFRLYAEFNPRSQRIMNPNINWRFSGRRAEFDKVRDKVDQIISKTSDDITNSLGAEVASGMKARILFHDIDTNVKADLLRDRD